MAGQNPLHLVVDPLLTFALGRLDSGLFWLRLPAVVLGSASVWLLWRLASPSGGRRALAACLLLACSPFHIDWSIRVDFYALLVFLALAQSWALLAGAWLWYGACAAVFAYSHPYAWLVAAIHGAFLVLDRRSLRAWTLSWASAAVLLAPWALYSTRLLAAGPAFARGLNFSARQLALLFAATPSTASGLGSPGALGYCIASLFVATWLYSLWRTRLALRGCPMRLAHLTLLLGPCLVLALDGAFGYFFAPRALLWLLPFYLLAAADGALGLLDSSSAARRMTIAGIAGAAIIFELACGYARTFGAYAEIGRRQKELVEQVRARVKPGDAFAFESRELAYCFLYDYDREAFRALPPFRFDGVPLGTETIMIGHAGPESTWRVKGSVGDVYVYPPLRATPPARRNGGST